ncbi:DUF2268 domain-containing putative Zn-dependent protease [Ureibacillus sinduriensis]|uniref:Zn-dependent protease n=1 Tax=Ureibacillus sinduriensis BLB-1 = JCM 15800 TaxID=1384057 RepID=A0A0A3IJU0_9BACL|nr:DUF2268 domain-containing putative Zn-dependent protease [Ureibacillus sinduriensis]KGR75137.1 Zn-dependent protease [Ureibacillus sinduriensis BLB-1 = JCM 15800]
MNNYHKTNATFIFIRILLLLTSCTTTEKSEEPLHKKEYKTDITETIDTFEHPQTNQKYKIVHTSQLFERYLDKVKENPSEATLELYQEEIIQPVYKECFENGEYLHMAEALFNSHPDNLAELEIINEKLELRKNEVNELIQESLLKSAELLPSQKDVAICVFPSSNLDSYMFAAGAGKIIITYNKNFMNDIIRVGVAHEYHHSVWTEKHLSNEPMTVLDTLIFEGKAVMFEKTVYPNLDSTPVDSAYNKELWSKIEPDLNKYDLDRSLEIIVGGNDLPWSYGYSEGYKMVKSYLDVNPNLTPEEWTALSSKEIIEKGKYFDHYK